MFYNVCLCVCERVSVCVSVCVCECVSVCVYLYVCVIYMCIYLCVSVCDLKIKQILIKISKCCLGQHRSVLGASILKKVSTVLVSVSESWLLVKFPNTQ